jgi:hypothetical protein
MKICKEAKIKFVANTLAIYLNDKREFVRLARATFNYSPNTVDADIILSFDKAWKEYLNGNEET